MFLYLKKQIRSVMCIASFYNIWYNIIYCRKVLILQMRTVEYVGKLNKLSHVADIDKVCSLKGYYMSMYRFYMLKLYDIGYIEDPTVYDEITIRRNLADLNIVGIKSTIGSYILNSDRIRYTLYKNKGEEQQEFLLLLYNALLYREYCKSIDSLYDIYYKKDTFTLNVRAEKGMFVPKNDIVFTKANMRCLIEEEYTVGCNTIAYKQLEIMYESIGVPFEDYAIDKDLTIEDTMELIPVIFGNHPPDALDGEYADVVKSWFKKYNRSIESHFYSHNAPTIFDLLEEILNKMEYSSIIAIYKNKIFYKKEIEYMKYPIGFFSITGGYGGDIVSTNEDINGYVGECYTEDYLINEGYNYIGAPIYVNNTLVYDREQINMDSQSWFLAEDIDFEFEEPTILNISNEKDAIQSTKEGKLGIIKLD